METLYKKVLANRTLTLPIIKIDGIRVISKLNVLHHLNNWNTEPNTVSLEISLNELYVYDDSASNYAEFEQMLNSIKHMKFDTFSGEFYTPTAVFSKNHQPSCYPMSFLEFSNVVVNYDECCVCFHQTTTMTLCEHYLCHGCHLQLKKKICPLCRNSLNDIILD
jgi:hypothetical protein